MIYASQTELNEALAYWQKVLRLQDWRITAEVVRGRQFDSATQTAGTNLCTGLKEAKITLRDPIDYESPRGTPQDHELDLIHELLHLHLEPLIEVAAETNGCYLLKEQVIECLATGFVSLKTNA